MANSTLKSSFKFSLDARNLEDLSKEEIIRILLDLGAKYNDQIDMIEELLGQNSSQNKNSTNTSKPPSTDSIRTKLDRKKHKNRSKSTKKSGGQIGHIGTTLVKQTPTKIVQIKSYNPNIVIGTILQTCQVIDVIVRKEVLEYQLISTKTKNDQTLKAKLPFKGVVYSSNLKAQIAYFSTEHAISDNRIIRLFNDLYGFSISGGTVTNTLLKAKLLLEPINTKILNAIQTVKVLGSDETFMSLNGNLAFLWNWQNSKYSYFKASTNRKYDNITETIRNYQGMLISDRYAAHLKLESNHQLCTVHLQRNIKALSDSEFKTQMLDILGESQKADKNQENYIFYRQRLKSILDNLPTTLDKQSKRLAKSLIKNQDHIFNFLLNPEIPHHNNDTERELRKSKIKSKIAGCFRTLNGFETYASNLTFIQTCRKQGQNIYTQLQKIFNLESPDLVWE